MLHIAHHGSVVVWTLDRPEAKNALDYETMRALVAAIEDAATGGDIRVAILTGAGDAFVSGGDLRELRERCSVRDAEELCDAGRTLTTAIAQAPYPVLAALPGPAIGGGAELALACDLRIAERRAHIAFKHVRMGVTTAWDSIAKLTALVGAGGAARLLFTAEAVSATDAKSLGLVDEVTDDGAACDTALAWASSIARGSPTAVAETKRLLRAVLAAPAVRAAERDAFVATWSAPDHREAVEAFFERRTPHFRARSDRPVLAPKAKAKRRT